MSAIRKFSFEVATVLDEAKIAWTPKLTRLFEKAVVEADRTWMQMSEEEVEHLAKMHEGVHLIRVVETMCKRRNWD